MPPSRRSRSLGRSDAVVTARRPPPGVAAVDSGRRAGHVDDRRNRHVDDIVVEHDRVGSRRAGSLPPQRPRPARLRRRRDDVALHRCRHGQHVHPPRPADGHGGEPLPLVLDLHGYSEPATVHVQQSGLATYGDTAGFVTAIPQITRPVPRWDSTVGSPDVQYIDQLLDQLEATVCVDTNRVYVAGLSNGAFMTSILACDLSDRIAAVSAGGRHPGARRLRPDRPVPVIAFHGTADTFVPYTGGLGSSVAALPNADGTGTIGSGPPSSDPVSTGPSVPERAATWAVRNGCAADPTETPVADDVTLVQFAVPTGRRGRALPGRGRRPLLAGQSVLRVHRLGRRQDDPVDRRHDVDLGLLRRPPAPAG